MKQLSVLILLLNLGLVPSTNAAIDSKNFRSTVSQLMKKHKVSESEIGMIVSAQQDKWLAINEKKQFIPASISKLFTTYSVLKNMNPLQKFKTELFYDNKNIYLKGNGDPSFVSENLWFLVNEFTRQNIKLISGDIIVDDFLFDQIRYDVSRESSRVDRSYDAPVGAMSFNWNSINIYVKPTTNKQKAQVILDPENSYFRLVNKTVTQSGRITKELIIDVNQKDRIITVSGEVSAKADEKAYYKNVAEPDMWAAENLKSFLAQRGILVKGQIRKGKVPNQAERVAVYEGKNLSLVLADMNKFSNNYVAEMLTKNLSALSGQQPATLAHGVDLIKRDIRQLGLTDGDFYFENPSGFTRDNKMNVYSMDQVLLAIQNDFRMFPTVLESLPIAGLDGTLKKRMKNSAAEGYVRAKTGYLDGVVALAGYIGLRDGQVLRFAFLYNGPRDEANVREFFDHVLESLLE